MKVPGILACFRQLAGRRKHQEAYAEHSTKVIKWQERDLGGLQPRGMVDSHSYHAIVLS